MLIFNIDMSRWRSTIAVASICLTGLAATCPTAVTEVSRERAIEIARGHATFDITTVEASKTTEQGRPVWRVLLQGAAASAEHPLLRPTLIVFIDRHSGEVISIAKG